MTPTPTPTSSVQIDLIYKAKTPLGTDLEKLVAALQILVTRDFSPVWGVDAKLTIQTAPRLGVWRLLFLDDADQAGELGDHELTPDGLPQGRVFVQTTLDDGENPATTASHEVLEMLADPFIDRVANRSHLFGYAVEVADPGEEQTYKIDRLDMSNFVTPGWFIMPNAA